MSIEKINRKSISELVFEQIKDGIINGHWKPGQKLPSENKLVEKFGVSRTSVRSALKKLEVLSLIEKRQGEGTYVRKLNASMYLNSLIPLLVLEKQDLLEVLEFRRIIESETARLAAERATDDDLKKLSESFVKMKNNTNIMDIFAFEDFNFHIIIEESAKNTFLKKVNYIIRDIYLKQMKEIVKNIGYEIGLYYHEKILKAIYDHNSDNAAKYMKEHIQATIEAIENTSKK